MPKTIKIYGLMAVPEGSYGAGGTPVVGSDGIRLAAPAYGTISYGYDGSRSRDPATGGPSELAAKAAKSVAFPAQIELRGRGSAYGASALPWDFDVLARACGLGRTVVTTVGAETVTYAPSTEVSAAPWLYAIGEVWKAKGALGSLNVELSQPGVVTATAQMQAFFDGDIVDDAATAPTIVYGAQVPPTALGATVQIGTFVAGPTSNVALRAMRFAQNLEITPRNDIASPDGLIGFVVGSFEPTLEIELEAHSLSTASPWHEGTKLNPYKMADFSTPVAISCRWGTGGDGTTYNRIQLAAARGQLINAPQISEDGQSAIWTLQFRLAPSAPGQNDHFSLLFD